MVKVEYNCKTGHEEQHEYYPELLLALLAVVKLPSDTDYSQNEWQGKEYIASLIVLDSLWQLVLVAQTYVVNKWYACYPVAILLLAIIVLYVILAADEIPKEIAPVHVVYLVVDKETYVVQLCRNLYVNRFVLLFSDLGELCPTGVLYVFAHPFLVFSGVVAAVHTWEEHVLHVFVLLVVVDYLILVGVACVLLLYTHVDWACLYRYGIAVLGPVYLGIEALAIEQRA